MPQPFSPTIPSFADDADLRSLHAILVMIYKLAGLKDADLERLATFAQVVYKTGYVTGVDAVVTHLEQNKLPETLDNLPATKVN